MVNTFALVPLAIAVGMLPSSAAQSILDVTTRESLGTQGVEANERCLYPQSSLDGRFVAFQALASNLVPGDTNGKYDIFVRDTQTGAIELVSKSTLGVQGAFDSGEPQLSADGRFVAFSSSSPGLVPGDTNGSKDVFLRDRQAGTLIRVSVGSGGTQASGWSDVLALSSGGDKVVFWSLAENLVPGDTNGLRDLFLYDTGTGLTERINLDSAGNQMVQPVQPPPFGDPHPWFDGAAVSTDGRFVAFATNTPELDPLETNVDQDVFLRDRLLGTTARLSVGYAAHEVLGESGFPAITPDGRWISFHSNSADLVPGDTNSTFDVFVYDHQLGGLERVSLGSYGGEAAGGSMWSSLSDDGRFVAFESGAANLVAGDTNGVSDIFVRDRVQTITCLQSRSSLGAQGSWGSSGPALSGDGRFLYFMSGSPDLVVGDTNAATDVFRHDPLSGGPGLSVAGLVAGQTATLQVQGATPTATLLMGMSLAGQGALPSPWGLIDLAPPLWVFVLQADAAGSAQLVMSVPAGLFGWPLWIQGIDTIANYPSATFGALIQ